MKNVLILDVETTTKNKGNPFTQSNKCVCIGLKETQSKEAFIDYADDEFNTPFNNELIQGIIDDSNLIVGFNIKFDLHWLRNIGIDISKIKVWDCQLAEFILNNQHTPYPSLNDAANKYGLPCKLDVVKNDYWDKGIDTDAIPRPILSEYLSQDLQLTQAVFEKQYEILRNDPRFNLFRLHCADLLVLEEMEYNGIQFDTAAAMEKSKEIQTELDSINDKLRSFLGDVPFNPNSGDHVSAALYGGKIKDEVRIPIGVYKSGEKCGQTRYKVVIKEYELPRLCEPIEGTETKKSKEKDLGIYEVNETVLRKLKLSKKAREFVDLLNRQAELEKLNGTYLKGYTSLIEKMEWPTDTIHGMLNQCVVITGRLSSSKPNLQNVDPETKRYMRTRYA